MVIICNNAHSMRKTIARKWKKPMTMEREKIKKCQTQEIQGTRQRMKEIQRTRKE